MLFDVASDPAEVDNLYEDRPEIVAELEERIRYLLGTDIQAFEAFQASITSPSGEVDLTDEEIENPKALAYHGD